MKKKLALFVMVVCLLGCCGYTSCSEAERVNENLAEQADNFNIVRRVTVINCIEGDVLFEMQGKMCIKSDTADKQLEVIAEEDGRYTKHIIGLSDNVTYVVEDLNLGKNDVSKYKYTINYNPKMWIPIRLENID